MVFPNYSSSNNMGYYLEIGCDVVCFAQQSFGLVYRPSDRQ